LAKDEGIISAMTLVRKGGTLYSVLGGAQAQVSSILGMELYDRIGIKEGTAIGTGRASEQEYKAMLQKSVRSLRINANAKSVEFGGKPYGAKAKAMLPRLAEAAEALARALVTGAPVVVRYHNDGDGASGAVALYRAVSGLQAKIGVIESAVSWRMNKRIAYGVDELYRDRMFFDMWKSVEKPVLYVTDFGTSPESVDSLRKMKETATVIVIDHHPPYAGFPRDAASTYLNSWDLGADSDFTAGLLSSLVSELLFKTDVEDLKDASLICDYSTYARDDENARRNALVLDFMTYSRTESASPASMNAVLTDKEKRDGTFMRANGMQEEALAEAMKRIKSYKSSAGVNVFTLDFGHIAALDLEFPPLGRLSSILQKRVEALNGMNAVTVVYALANISVRVSGKVADKVRLLDAIARLKSSVDYPVSGGGHMKAAGVSVDSSHMDEIVGRLLFELGVAAR